MNISPSKSKVWRYTALGVSLAVFSQICGLRQVSAAKRGTANLVDKRAWMLSASDWRTSIGGSAQVPNWAGPAVAGFLAAWIAVLTFWIFKQQGLVKALFPKSGERDIRKKFEEVLKEIESFNRDLAQIKDKLAEIALAKGWIKSG